MTNGKTSVALLGAGISGLSTAYALSKKGVNVTVYEQSSEAGGSIRTGQKDGWLIEHGPNTLMVRSKEIWNLLGELGLKSEILEANRNAKKRFIVRNGKPLPLPGSILGFLRTGLFSGSAKLRLFKEPFINPGNKEDESIADFVSRRLGKEILDYAINPFVAGIFAGDPQKLSLKHTFSMLYELEQEHGSLSKGMIKKRKGSSGKKALISFKKGLQRLPQALHNELGESVCLNHRITALKFSESRWQLQFQNGKSAEHDIVISCLPAHSLSEIMQGEKPANTIGRLEKIPYAPMSVLHLGYKSEKIQHPLDGFGMLVPEVEDFEILGALFSSTLFEGRAPDNHSLLTVFMGGARNPELAHQSKDELVEKAQLELDQLLGVSGTPEFVNHTYWKHAIPQYEVGYESYLKTMQEAERKFNGFFLAGNIRNGVSVPDCIGNGLETAEKVALFING